VLHAVDEVILELGGPTAVKSYLPVLEDMKTYSKMLILLSLVFSVVTILFVTISTLLVYSLLMISMETKTFENGVMRLSGLSKYKVSGMIML
jgi:hypothetical protein